jgi:hypothetical protein
VTQASNALQTVAFARRVVCRALTVLGGVAAGTALAWWLSTTAASAETPSPPDDMPQAVQVVTAPVEQAAETAVSYLPDPPPPPKEQLADLGQKLTDTAQQFRDNADSTLPDCGVCLGTQKHHYVADSLGRSDVPSAPPVATPVASTIAPFIVTDTVTPRTAKDRALADGMSRRGSPAPVGPALPGLPGWPVPIPSTPAGIPTTGNHSASGSSSDSHLLAALPWQDRNTELVAGGTAATTKAATFGRPGAQPGVAPD